MACWRVDKNGDKMQIRSWTPLPGNDIDHETSAWYVNAHCQFVEVCTGACTDCTGYYDDKEWTLPPFAVFTPIQITLDQWMSAKGETL